MMSSSRRKESRDEGVVWCSALRSRRREIGTTLTTTGAYQLVTVG